MTSNKEEPEIFPNPCSYVKDSTYKILPFLKNVSIDEDSLNKFVSEILSNKEGIHFDPWSTAHIDACSVPLELLLRYLFIIDTLNFCFWPNEGYEYIDLAQNLAKTLKENKNFFEIENLIKITPEELKKNVFKCEFCLLNERARMIREVFIIIKNKYEGKCTNFVKLCQKNSAKLVQLIVDNFCCYRDNSIYNGEQVFFYKRAQILAADMYLAFVDIKNENKVNEENEIINFSEESVSQLTMFADYRVPQILRAKGILKYSHYLDGLIDEKKILEYGSKEEVEIRAATVQTVEKIKEIMKNKGKNILSIEIDVYLWIEGEKLKDKIAPHHRTVSVFY